jgi:putative RecB family exonuclease
VETLSPSRAADFKTCPQLYKFRAIDRLPEPSDPYRARGTLVHAVLEQLCRLPADQRSPEVAQLLLDEVWAVLKQDDELAGLELSSEEEASWLSAARHMLGNYFLLEDPAGVEVHDVEAWVTHEGERTTLRGIIDRIEIHEDGGWVLADYKTGRSPSNIGALGSFFGLQFYALVCWRAFGKMPRELRLMHLGVPEVLTLRPNEQMLRGVERQMDALAQAIARARARDDWRPRPGALCPRCAHRSICPAWTAETGPAVASGAPEAGAGARKGVGDPLLVNGGGGTVAGIHGDVPQREEPVPDGGELLIGIPTGQVGAANRGVEESVA